MVIGAKHRRGSRRLLPCTFGCCVTAASKGIRNCQAGNCTPSRRSIWAKGWGADRMWGFRRLYGRRTHKSRMRYGHWLGNHPAGLWLNAGRSWPYRLPMRICRWILVLVLVLLLLGVTGSTLLTAARPQGGCRPADNGGYQAAW